MSYSQECIQIRDVNSTFESVSMSDYCPISVKEENNPPSVSEFDALTNIGIFLSEKNANYMTYYITSYNKTKYNPNLLKISKQIPNLMKQWASKQNLNDFKGSYDNILEILAFLNKKFLVNHAYLFENTEMNNINVFKSKDEITDKLGHNEMKKYEEMTADEYRTLDVWREQQVFTYDKLNKYQNKIPTWQKSMNIRQYDKSNDGLHVTEPERASLDTQIRGYNMENIHKGLEFYQVPGYEFI